MFSPDAAKKGGEKVQTPSKSLCEHWRRSWLLPRARLERSVAHPRGPPGVADLPPPRFSHNRRGKEQSLVTNMSARSLATGHSSLRSPNRLRTGRNISGVKELVSKNWCQRRGMPESRAQPATNAEIRCTPPPDCQKRHWFVGNRFVGHRFVGHRFVGSNRNANGGVLVQSRSQPAQET